MEKVSLLKGKSRACQRKEKRKGGGVKRQRYQTFHSLSPRSKSETAQVVRGGEGKGGGGIVGK